MWKRQPESCVTPRGADGARVIEVVETTAICGKGTPDDPCRHVLQYWDFEGKLLAKYDTWRDDPSFSSEEPSSTAQIP